MQSVSGASGSAHSASASVAANAASSAPAAAAPAPSHVPRSGRKKTVLKVILLGQAGVGKTALLNRFVDDVYHPQYKATLGADMRDKEVLIGDEPVVLQVWDTAGQERFNSLTSMYLKGADMVLLVFDMTRADSFESLNLWRDQFLASTRHTDDFPFACVANKCDVASQRAVSQRRANQWCAEKGDMPFYEVSAKESTNVRLAFMAMARRAMKRRQAERAAEQAATAAAAPPAVVLPKPSAPGQQLGSQDKKSRASCCS